MPAKGQRDVGTAYHAGVEALHKGESLPAALIAVQEKIDELRSIRFEGQLPELTKEQDPEWYDVYRYAKAMVEGYAEELATGIDAGVETLEVEQEWEQLIPGTDLVYFGKRDLVTYEEVRHGLAVWDVKSVDKLEQPHRSDFQLRTYAWSLWRSNGVPPSTAGHRQARRVLRSAQSKPPYYLEN
jgi:hypothetical protein